MLKLIWIVPMAPLLGALVCGVLARRREVAERVVSIVACVAIAISFAVAVGAVVEFGKTRWSHEQYTVYVSSEDGTQFPNAFVWIPGGAARTTLGDEAGRPVDGGVTVAWSYQVDALGSVMLLIVTGVGLLIHIFAVGYMRGDPGYARFFAYMNLFMFSMLVLVLGSSFPMLFVGWEGVGLCSYLLIGFWYTKNENADAAKKAFIVNRIGDAGFLLGMFGLFAIFGTFDFTALRAAFASGGAHYAETFGQFGLISLCALGLFVGATGKSAQIPLFVWLPDAMAGPTPVSALIHAATMVTAGVFMVARVNFVFDASPTMMFVVALVGALTALFAATIAVTQFDIKKVLAYSTVSQLGLMFLACGVGAYSMAIFHVMTHAFFKALLFLGAGSVIHALHHEQDMRKMGGLRKHLPVTYATMACGWLAICGVFPLSGFFSKDGILWEAWASHVIPPPYGKILWAMGLAASALTAFYMTRMMAMTFFGKPAENSNHTPHESPRVMTVPLAVLALLAVVGGWIGIGAVIPVIGSHQPPILRWLAPVVAEGLGREPAEGVATEALLAFVALAVAVGAIALALQIYARRPEIADRLAARFGPLYRLSFHKYWVDELYHYVPVGLVIGLSRMSFRTDANIVDGAVNGVGWTTRVSSRLSGLFDFKVVDGIVNLVAQISYYGSLVIRAVQTGLFQNYALAIVLGVAVIIVGYEWSAITGLVGSLTGSGR